MSIYIPEENEIYFAKTKEYFQEVLSSYANKNYRSATVMLYSVVICDLLFKLEELKNMYDDSQAAKILEDINKNRNSNGVKSKSLWEKELVDKIHKNTELLGMQAYTNLLHLYDNRNFSAHPALNVNYELISPSKETTIANIQNALNDILIKPPIFIKNVFEALIDDLKKKKYIYENNYDELINYLNKKYFSRMPKSMKEKTFSDLWKFCFCKSDDVNCADNSIINRMALNVLSDDNSISIEEILKDKKEKFNVSSDDNCINSLIIYLSKNPKIFPCVCKEVDLKIQSFINNNPEVLLICWFKYNSLNEHIDAMKKENIHRVAKLNGERIIDHYQEVGEINILIKYVIEMYGGSESYDSADSIFDNLIKPSLKFMSIEQFNDLIEKTVLNNQILDRRNAYNSNNQIIEACYEKYGNQIDYDKINGKFKFNKSIVEADEEFPF